MVEHDIFISYRRSDAEAYAYMLYRDLKNMGYNVFHDYNSLGNGDFLEAIHEAVTGCKDVIVILSQESLGARIWNDDDIMRYELETALTNKKKIVGIMLPGFEHFPEKLPDSICSISRMNCLSSKMEYYDAMLDRLTSGRFLTSIPHRAHNDVVQEDRKMDKKAALDHFQKMSGEEKRGYMRFLLDLGHEFNSSPECMRLYKYLDMFERNRGVTETPPYSGNIPTDYATYLSFFETLYLILYTETLDMALVDEMYRFRFFALCNNPEIQRSELLPLGYQYPNVLALYDMWIEHIRELYSAGNTEMDFMDAVPLYEFDLQKRYALNTFAMNPSVPRSVVFTNRVAAQKKLTIKRLTAEYFTEVCSFQKYVVNGIDNNDTDNLFEPLSEQELRDALECCCFALMDGDRIVAMLSVIPNPREESNLLMDLEFMRSTPPEKIMILDCVLVDPEYRGFRIQRSFFHLAEFCAERMEIKYLCGVVSPKNYFSTSNFIKAGYQLVGTRSKYHSVRNYFLKTLHD